MTEPSEFLDEVVASDLVDDPLRSPHLEPIRAQITARRRRQWGKEAALVGTTLGSIGVFVALARAIGGPGGTSLDRRVVRAVGRSRGPWLGHLAQAVTFFGGVPGATLTSSSALIAARKSPRLALQVVAGALGGSIAELVLKRFFRRKRPTILEHLEVVRSSSFPSGHAMAASSLYLTLAFVASRSRRLRDHRAALLVGASALASAVGATRVYLGVHWPTDVLGGLALGTAWACGAEAAFDFSGAERMENVVAAIPSRSCERIPATSLG